MGDEEDPGQDGQDGTAGDDLATLAGPDDGVVSMDDVLEALADPTRRFVLHYLRDREVASVDELAREVAAREADTTPEAVSEAARERASLRLSHAHLAKLADLHLVEYDARSATVRYSDPPMRLEAVLRLLEQLEAGRS